MRILSLTLTEFFKYLNKWGEKKKNRVSILQQHIWNKAKLQHNSSCWLLNYLRKKKKKMRKRRGKILFGFHILFFLLMLLIIIQSALVCKLLIFFPKHNPSSTTIKKGSSSLTRTKRNVAIFCCYCYFLSMCMVLVSKYLRRINID